MRFKLILAFLIGTTAAHADVSGNIAKFGLRETEQQLTDMPAPNSNDQLALGAVRFLRGIEKTLQLRWRSNMSVDELSLPVLRLPFTPNPSPEPFRASLIKDLFVELNKDMADSREALASIPADADVTLELNLGDIWFDVNTNNTRDEGEDLDAIALGMLAPQPGFDESEPVPATPTIRFDHADSAWLMAYTELLSGFSEFVIAFDPTPAIERVYEANSLMQGLLGDDQPTSGLDNQFGGWVDQFSIAYSAINKKPDAGHLAAARVHWLNMIEDNRVFWARVDAETDNEREWIPNDRQTAALGFELPPGTGDIWLGILNDGEALLNGDLLVSYWRIAPVGGINLQKLFQDPPAVDIVDWVQGMGLVPYLERGPTVSSQRLRQFEAMISGDALLFAFLLN